MKGGWRAFVVTVGGSGYAPFASGTWGSLAALLPYTVIWWLLVLTGGPWWLVDIVLVLGVVASTWLSVALGGWAIATYQTRSHKKHPDPSEFVLDEFAGQWLSLLALPVVWGGSPLQWLVVVGGQFLLFRFFDIAKLPPSRQCEKLPGGWGIVVDDLWAGLYALIVGQLLWQWTPLMGWIAPLFGGSA